MVSRSAYSQLNHSPLLLLGTVTGMALLFLVPPFLLITGILGLIFPNLLLGNIHKFLFLYLGTGAWFTMSTSFIPIFTRYGFNRLYILLAPLSGLLYTMMTVDSAISWFKGDGGNWKGRSYNNGES